jgi:hypothetical protein
MFAQGTKLALAAAGLALAAPMVLAAPAGPPGSVRVRIESRGSAAAVERALAGARRRLAHPDCRRIFRQFHDRRGQPLSRQLEALGATPEDHLAGLFFYDGRAEVVCRNARKPLAYTHVGSRVVFVCASFEETARRHPFVAEAALIHESLHTLGLGENPPSSRAITSRVMSTCR